MSEWDNREGVWLAGYESGGVLQLSADSFRWTYQVKTYPHHWHTMSKDCMKVLFDRIIEDFTPNGLTEIEFSNRGVFVTLLLGYNELKLTNVHIRLDTNEGRCCDAIVA